MRAILTKYHGPTDYLGARISAHDGDGNYATIGYPHELSGEDCYRLAAEELCLKMRWTGRMIGGAIRGGYAFVFVDDDAVRSALRTMIDHASETYPHFESERGQRDIAAAKAAL